MLVRSHLPVPFCSACRRAPRTTCCPACRFYRYLLRTGFLLPQQPFPALAAGFCHSAPAFYLPALPPAGFAAARLPPPPPTTSATFIPFLRLLCHMTGYRLGSGRSTVIPLPFWVYRSSTCTVATACVTPHTADLPFLCAGFLPASAYHLHLLRYCLPADVLPHHRFLRCSPFRCCRCTGFSPTACILPPACTPLFWIHCHHQILVPGYRATCHTTVLPACVRFWILRFYLDAVACLHLPFSVSTCYRSAVHHIPHHCRFCVHWFTVSFTAAGFSPPFYWFPAPPPFWVYATPLLWFVWFHWSAGFTIPIPPPACIPATFGSAPPPFRSPFSFYLPPACCTVLVSTHSAVLPCTAAVRFSRNFPFRSTAAWFVLRLHHCVANLPLRFLPFTKTCADASPFWFRTTFLVRTRACSGSAMRILPALRFLHCRSPALLPTATARIRRVLPHCYWILRSMHLPCHTAPLTFLVSCRRLPLVHCAVHAGRTAVLLRSGCTASFCCHLRFLDMRACLTAAAAFSAPPAAVTAITGCFSVFWILLVFSPGWFSHRLFSLDYNGFAAYIYAPLYHYLPPFYTTGSACTCARFKRRHRLP